MILTKPNYLEKKSFLKLDELPGFDNLRTNALDNFNQSGLPTLRHEDWKYSNVQMLAQHNFRLNDSSNIHTHSLKFPEISGKKIVFVDGRFKEELSDTTRLKNQITVMPLLKALEQVDLKPYLHQAARSIQHGFAHLNTLLLAQGIVIMIEPDASVAEPIHIIFYNTKENTAAHLRNIIIAKPHSSAEIIEHYYSASGKYLTNSITEIYLKEAAKLNYYKLIEESNMAYHISHSIITQEKDSASYVFTAPLRGRFVRNDHTINLQGVNGNCHLAGIYHTQGRQHTDMHTQIHHLKPHTKSEEHFKGVLRDFSRAVFNGKIYVHTNASHCNATQINKNLLLSEHAEIDTRPQLEIYNDEVQCSHGATIGQLDQKSLFYLRSRGIKEPQAKAMLIAAFDKDLVDAIPQPALKRYIEHYLAGQYHE